MSNEIVDFQEVTDRSDLDVAGRRSVNKNIIIGVLVLTSIAIVGAGAFFSFRALNKESAETTFDKDPSYKEGSEKSALQDSDAFFESVKRKKKEDEERKKREEERLKQLAEDAAKREEERLRKQAELAKQLAAPTAPPPPPVVSSPGSGGAQSQPNVKSEYELSHERKLKGNVLIQMGGGLGSDDSFGSSDGSGFGNYDADYSDSYDSPKFSAGSASYLPSEVLDYMLQSGMVIPCAIYNQIISDYQGVVLCRTLRDVYSSNGANLLVKRGSLIEGDQSIQLENGKGRIFTTWSRIKTPDNYVININSLGTGPLGASGIPAWVDNHYLERFGGAVLLSFIDDAFKALADSQSSDNITFDNSTENANNMAETVLDNSINISPTGYSKLGQRINILLVRDINMKPAFIQKKKGR
jgi:type IV secretion system protein VirB10